jgi:SAM-dependent methyltransferase
MFAQYKYRFAKKFMRGSHPKALEVGIGNDSPMIFKKYYPYTEYHGVDKTFDYNLSEESKNAVDKFFQMDLEKESLSVVPNDYYDFVLIAHVIEHLDNGYDVLRELTRKVKKGGGIYIEYPRRASAKFPSMKGTLNFYDDPTHKRFYDIDRIKEILNENGFSVVRSGTKRDFSRIVGLPVMIIKSYLTLGYIRGSVFWDLLGFAEYVLAVKNE